MNIAIRPAVVGMMSCLAALAGADGATFEQVSLPTSAGAQYTSLTIGPDGQLYGLTLEGQVRRWSIDSDGILGAVEILDALQVAEGADRLAIGLAFDPASTPQNLIAWVSHSEYGFSEMADWTGKITRLSGSHLQNVQDFIVGLPRSSRDHTTNSMVFGPDGALYVVQGSNSAMGAPDPAWADRAERGLSAAVLRFDTLGVATPPLDVMTELPGTYDPYAPGAALTIHASGLRNAYDLVWHGNGHLYIPNNGSAPNGNTPEGVVGAACADGSSYGGPAVTGLVGVSIQPDYLLRIEPGGYYGHPNPQRCEFAMSGANPTAAVDPLEVTEYPEGTLPDSNYRGAVFDFGTHKSPNGIIEYRSAGDLQGALLVVRYSSGDDLMALTPSGSGLEIVASQTGITGLTGFNNPLDVVENLDNGHLYVSEFGASKITLCRPLGGSGVPDIGLSASDLVYSGLKDTVTPAQVLTLSNTGTADLEIATVALTGADAGEFTIVTPPTTPVTLIPGAEVMIDIAFSPGATAVGTFSAAVEIASDDPNEAVVQVGVHGLSADGLEGSNEPTLHDVVQTLGHAIDVGGTELELGVDAAPIGDEVPASLFTKSGSGDVVMVPVARYSPAFALPYGYYGPNGAAPSLTQVGVLSGASSPAEHQTLFPEMTSGVTTFDPGPGAFGFYITSPSHTAYTEDDLNIALNPAQSAHSARVYPLKDRQGFVVPYAYFVAFEDAFHGDYQDFDFVVMNVQLAPSGDCAVLAQPVCADVPVTLPHKLDWDASEDGLVDNSGVGTGFTMVDPPSNGAGYLPNNLAVDTGAGTLTITTTPGIQFGETANNPNSLDNGLGVAWDASAQDTRIETTIINLPAVSGQFEQAGVWFFLNESHYIKLVVVSDVTGSYKVEILYEQSNQFVESSATASIVVPGDHVKLTMVLDPQTSEVSGLVQVNGGGEMLVDAITVNNALFSGVTLPDGMTGPVSFAGVFATQRNGSTLDFVFEDFCLAEPAAPPALAFSPALLPFMMEEGSNIDSASTTVTANDGQSPTADIAAVDDATGLEPTWLTVAAQVTADIPFDVEVATDGLAPGAYTATVTATSSGYADATLMVTLQVTPGAGCNPISMLDCVDVPVSLPFKLDWEMDEGGLEDVDGDGTGFTMVDPPSNAAGYLPGQIDVDIVSGELALTTTAGIQFTSNNSLDNGLGVAVDATSELNVDIALNNLPVATRGFAQAGGWVFLDEDTYVKLIVFSSTPGNYDVEVRGEEGGSSPGGVEIENIAVSGDDVVLSMSLDPTTQEVTAAYAVNGGAAVPVGTVVMTSDLFNGVVLPDGMTGPVTFAGLFATHRNAPAAQVFSFERFCITGPCVPPVIVTPPESSSVCSGDSVVLDVTPSGSVPLTYAWRFQGTPIPGADQPTLLIDPVGPADAGDYDVVVTNSCGDATSLVATLDVVTPADCADGLECTDDSCTAGVCSNVASSAGTPCTADTNPCTDDACDGAGNCVATDNTLPCDDGLVCTVDTCTDGSCVGVPDDSLCDDFDDCTLDTCVAGVCDHSPPAPTDPTCDGLDDDCDGSFDEDYVSSPSECGVGACAGNTGVLTCVAGAVEDSCDPFAGAAVSDTLCDGVDEDCDGLTDEDVMSTATTCGVGACASEGLSGCVDGVPTDSCVPGTPAVDDATCDGVDNDCDGLTDEDVMSTATTCGVGACASEGLSGCVDGVPTDSCVPGTPAVDDATCDGVDDDCDGLTDEDVMSTATTCGVGACSSEGLSGCVDGVPTDSCVPGTPAVDDATCDGVDDDCDGLTDEDVMSTATTCGVGACASEGLSGCVDGVPTDSCVPGTPAVDDATCDGVDDDCDGLTDEDVMSTATTCGVGACASEGLSGCVDGVPTDSCVPGTPAVDDATCDGVDDDCDGLTDEDVMSTATTCGVGACASEGLSGCVDGVPTDSCVPGTPAVDDATCDGIDDDCDAIFDEDFEASKTLCGIGACMASGMTVCVEGVVIDDCMPGEPAAEDATCDGIDDDCDDELDEDAIGCGGGDCTIVSDCADLDNNGVRDDGCVWWLCGAGVCQATEVVFGDMGGQFGACAPDGTADGNDRFLALNCFADVDPNTPPPASFPCEVEAPVAFNVDCGGQFGSCEPDGVCDGNDAFAALNAFEGASSCSCPLDGGPSPMITPEVVGTTAVRLDPQSPAVRPGGTVEVTVRLDAAVFDLRGYQLHFEVLGGTAGALDLIDLAVQEHDDHVFDPGAWWDAYNLRTRQLVAGLDRPGVNALDGAYLATLTLRASKDARGTFIVSLAYDPDDASARTVLFPTSAHGYIAIEEVTAAHIEVVHRRER